MIGESIAILAIMACMTVVFVRSGHADYGISVVPIAIVPAAHIISMPLAQMALSLYGAPPYLVRCFVDVTGLAVACLLLAVFSSRIRAQKNKKLYIIVCTLYCVILACVYIYNLLPRV